jgi:hypothetical protein
MAKWISVKDSMPEDYTRVWVKRRRYFAMRYDAYWLRVRKCWAFYNGRETFEPKYWKHK